MEISSIYNTHMICTYKLLKEEELDFETDETKIDELTKELEEDKKLLYQLQLLQVFYVQDFNECILNDCIDKLYSKISNEKFVQDLLNNNPFQLQFNRDKCLLFRTLFSYDLFDLFHRCIVDYYTNIDSNKHVKETFLEEIKKEFDVLAK